MRRIWITAAVLAALGTAALGTVALAQDWPSRPVTMIVTLAAGGEADVLGRVVAKGLSDQLGRSVVVENIVGAGGATGTARAAKAAPDGYQILIAGRGQFVLTAMSKTPAYLVSDFAHVALVAETPILLIARNDLPVENLQTFITYTKANQAKMQYGSPGAGSTPHLSCVLFNAAAGVSVTHVPYRGGGPAMQDLLAGRLDYQCTSVSTALPQIEAGKVKALAVLTRDRSPLVPAIPSAHEQGVTGFDASVWYGLFAPKATAAAVVERLRAASLAAMETPAIVDRLKDNGATVVTPARRSTAYMEKFVAEEIDKWAGAMRAAGVSGQ